MHLEEQSSQFNTVPHSFLPSFSPVDIREIRELRLGKASRDFERYPEEARKVDASHCFIVVYGLEFRLKTLSLAGQCSQRGAVASLNLRRSCDLWPWFALAVSLPTAQLKPPLV